MDRTVNELQQLACRIRIETIRALGVMGLGHVGGAMSMADLMAVLYGHVLNVDPQDPRKEDRDWVVVSKGHCGPSLYAALALKGYFPVEELATLNKPGTRLPSHCDRNRTPGVDISTGSLGQGMSSAIGVALGNRMKGLPSYTYLVLGDGECQEGQVWEGALFAPQRRLDHLIAFVDRNKKQLDGFTKDICDLGELDRKFRDFGWFTQQVDGNDAAALLAAIEAAKANRGSPSMIVMDTVKGKDCSFAEDVFYNHHMSFTPEQTSEAILALEQKLEQLRKEEG